SGPEAFEKTLPHAASASAGVVRGRSQWVRPAAPRVDGTCKSRANSHPVQKRSKRLFRMRRLHLQASFEDAHNGCDLLLRALMGLVNPEQTLLQFRRGFERFHTVVGQCSFERADKGAR